MNAFLNYVIEANLALIFGLLFYKLVLENETRFDFQRMFLLTIVVASLLLPLLHWKTYAQVIPSVSNVVPVHWLPEFSVNGSGPQVQTDAPLNFWNYASTIYWAGVVISAAIFLVQLLQLIRLLMKSRRYTRGEFTFIECDFKSTFSFFNYIFISSRDIETDAEKEQVINHETVHARRWHSMDIVLVQVLKILFWFNPVIPVYKKIFVHLHEFEADARAVADQDVDRYCSLLARIALQSAGLPLANHFNNSITLKRIQMMRTFKKNIGSWKIGLSLLILPLFFFAIACQDQILSEVGSSTLRQVSEYPAEVKADISKYSEEFPEAKFTYIEGTEAEVRKLGATEYTHHMILNTYVFGDKTGVLMKDLPAMKTEEGVFVVVEQMPEYPGGFDGLGEFLHNTIRYPEQARKDNISGTVYVQFVVDETGRASDAVAIKGVRDDVDAEAVRAVSLMPSWKPGMQNGQAVKTRMVLPVKFSSDFDSKALPISEDPYRMQPSVSKTFDNGWTILTGKITGQDGKGLAGINVVVKGTTTGTVTDANGNFKISVKEKTGTLACSFVGYETKTLSF